MAVQEPTEQHGAAWESPHAPVRWGQRTGGRPDENLMARWAEAVPVEIPRTSSDGADARAHPESDTVLVARYGEIRTVLEIAKFPADVEAEIRRQIREFYRS